MNAQLQWTDQYHSYLSSLIERLTEILEAHPSEQTQSRLLDLMSQYDDENFSALEVLSKTFSLSVFEKLLLLLCAGVELDSRLASVCHRLSVSGPTFSLALTIFPEPHWNALSPVSPLRYWRLLEVKNASSLVNAGLRIDERVLHYLTGVSYIDDRLQGYINVIPLQNGLNDTYPTIIERLISEYQGQFGDGPAFRLTLSGDDGAMQLSLIAVAMSACDIRTYRLRGSDIPHSVVERDSFIRLWERESLLSPLALVLDLQDDNNAELDRGVRQFMERLRTPLFINSTHLQSQIHGIHLAIEVPRLDGEQQVGLWQRQLESEFRVQKLDLADLVSQFDLNYSQIRQCAQEFKTKNSVAQHDVSGLLWSICRGYVRHGFDSLAQFIEPRASWDDLVLDNNLIEVLHDIVTQVRHRYTVHESWGFARKSQRGLGISALFAGPSGTGKTMAAEVLANELSLDLYRIDLSQVVSKYIGETEKNLRRVFDCAESSGAILLFDEADALFGKRSEVRDSHDRHANIEVSYLLQRMEAYRGLAVLTTNKKDDLDAAFLRRIRFYLHFPFPDIVQRKGIWQRIFPRQTPLHELDAEKLARLNISGGNIHNIAMNAAFFGASEQSEVNMEHLIRAVKREYAKLEKPLSQAELDRPKHGN